MFVLLATILVVTFGLIRMIIFVLLATILGLIRFTNFGRRSFGLFGGQLRTHIAKHGALCDLNQAVVIFFVLLASILVVTFGLIRMIIFVLLATILGLIRFTNFGRRSFGLF